MRLVQPAGSNSLFSVATVSRQVSLVWPQNILSYPNDSPDGPEGETEPRAIRVHVLGHTVSGGSVGLCNVLPYWAGLPL